MGNSNIYEPILPILASFDCSSYHIKDCTFWEAHDRVFGALELRDERCQQWVFYHKGPCTLHDCTLLHHLVDNFLWDLSEVGLHQQGYGRSRS